MMDDCIFRCETTLPGVSYHHGFEPFHPYTLEIRVLSENISSQDGED